VREAGPWVDALRYFVPPEEKLYTWWSYRARDWEKSDRGRRLDHVWASESLKPRLDGARILRESRGWERASDHVPVLVHFQL
jgi:exodeoxyribonuclease-3